MKRSLIQCLVLLLAVLLQRQTGMAQEDYWIQAPSSRVGFVTSVAIDQSGRVFAGTEGNGTHRLSDMNGVWAQTDTSGLGSDVYALAINNTDHIFAGTLQRGVFRSTNNGTSWGSIGLNGMWVQGLTITPSGAILAATYMNGIFRSSDNGTTWTHTTGGLLNQTFRSFAVAQNGTIYSGSGGDGLFRSTNDGTSWTFAGLGGQNILTIAFGPDGALLAGTYKDGIQLSSDNGESWSSIGPAVVTVWDMTVLPGGQIFAATSNGIYRSQGYGSCWHHMGFGEVLIRSVARYSSGHLVLGMGGASVTGVVRSASSVNATFSLDRCSATAPTTLIPFSSSFTMYVRNNGSSPVEITHVTTTDTEYVVSPTSAFIPVGDSVEFTITFDPDTLHGLHPATISFFSSSTNFPELLLINGMALSRRLRFADRFTVSTDSGTTRRMNVAFRNAGNDSLRVSNLILSNPDFELRPTSFIIPPNGQFVDTLWFRPTEAGRDSTTLTVESDAPTSPNIYTINGFAFTRILRREVSEIDFGEVLVNQRKDTVITLYNDGNDTIRVTDIISNEAAPRFFSARPRQLIIPPGGMVYDTLSFRPERIPTPNPRTARMIISSNARKNKDTIVVIGTATTTVNVKEYGHSPVSYSLGQNYPNPFNPKTTIKYSIAKSGFVSIKVFNLLGKEVATLVSRDLPVGEYEVEWDPADLGGGVYFYRILSGSFTDMKKLILLK